jgi:hypothetical protein
MRNFSFKVIALLLVTLCSGCGSGDRNQEQTHLFRDTERWGGGTSSE